MRKALVSRSHSSGVKAPEFVASSSEWESVKDAPSRMDLHCWSAPTEEDSFLRDMIFNHFTGCHPITGDPFLAGSFANNLGITRPSYQQYTIYLFERILLCCKEVNPNKSKDKLMGTQKDKKDKKDKSRNKEPNKNAKLQLKGRIFMTNVTEVLSLAKPSMYFVLLLGLPLTLNRFIFGSNILERGPGGRELYHSIFK